MHREWKKCASLLIGVIKKSPHFDENDRYNGINLNNKINQSMIDDVIKVNDSIEQEICDFIMQIMENDLPQVYINFIKQHCIKDFSMAKEKNKQMDTEKYDDCTNVKM